MRTLIIFAAVVFPCLAQTPSERASIEKAVLDVNGQMTRAAEAHDIDKLFSFMAPNEKGSIAQSGFLFLTREAAHDTVKRNFTVVTKVEYRWKHQMVTVISPDAAILAADGESVATFTDGTRATTPFAQTVVFVRTDGAWKALHAHQSSPIQR